MVETMDSGRDRTGGDGSDGDDADGDESLSIDLESALERAKEEMADGEQSRDEDRDHGRRPDDESGIDLESALENAIEKAHGADDPGATAGDADPDAVFDELQEASPEEVVQTVEAIETDPTATQETDEETEDDVEGLFGELSAVDLDPESGRQAGAGGDASASDARASGVEVEPDPGSEETAEEVEGLFGDLSAVDLEPEEPTTSEPAAAETRETVLEATTEEPSFVDTEASAGEFDWLGEDVHVFSSEEEEVDELFEEFEESSPEDVIAARTGSPAVQTRDASATALFDGLGRPGRIVGAADPPEPAPGWTSSETPDPTGVEATTMFERLAEEAIEPAESDVGVDVETATKTEMEADTDADIEDLEAARSRPLGGPSSGKESPVEESGVVVGESDVDAVFERFEESSPEEIIATAETESLIPDIGAVEEGVERLFRDLSGIDLSPDPAGPTVTPPSASTPGPSPTSAVTDPGSGTTANRIEELFGDLSDVVVEPAAAVTETAETDADVVEADSFEPAGATEFESLSAVEADSVGSEEMLERTGEDTHLAVGESDVNAVFERFEETSPEEVAETAPAAGADADATATGDADADTHDPEPEGGIVSKLVGFVSRLFP